MLRFCSDLYMSDTARKSKNKILRKLKHGRTPIGLYLLTEALNPADQLDIIPVHTVKQKLYKRVDIRVIGIAYSYEESLDLVVKIAKDVYVDHYAESIREMIIKDE